MGGFRALCISLINGRRSEEEVERKESRKEMRMRLQIFFGRVWGWGCGIGEPCVES